MTHTAPLTVQANKTRDRSLEAKLFKT
jgi:hypothetical protein